MSVAVALAKRLGVWTIYRPTAERPGVFVARRSYIGPNVILPSDDFEEGKTIEEVRAKLPAGLYRLDRDPSDDESIVETWL